MNFYKTLFKIVVGLVAFLFLILFWVLAMGMMGVSREITFSPMSSIGLPVLSYLVISFVIQYNKVIHLKQEISSSYRAIGIKEKYVVKLIGQLQEVTDKIVDHELKNSIKNTYSELVEEEKQADRTTSDGNDAQHSQTKKKSSSNSGSNSFHEHLSQNSEKVTKLVERIERDTKGKADESLRDLMEEIKHAEVLVANQYLHYNDMVSKYNKAIYALPFAFFRVMLGHSEQEYK